MVPVICGSAPGCRVRCGRVGESDRRVCSRPRLDPCRECPEPDRHGFTALGGVVGDGGDGDGLRERPAARERHVARRRVVGRRRAAARGRGQRDRDRVGRIGVEADHDRGRAVALRGRVGGCVERDRHRASALHDHAVRARGLAVGRRHGDCRQGVALTGGHLVVRRFAVGVFARAEGDGGVVVVRSRRHRHARRARVDYGAVEHDLGVEGGAERRARDAQRLQRRVGRRRRCGFSAHQMRLERIAVAPVDVDVFPRERRLSGLSLRERQIEVCGLHPQSGGVDARRERHAELALAALVVEPSRLEAFASALVREQARASGPDVAVAVVGHRHVGRPHGLAVAAGGSARRWRGVVVQDADSGFARVVRSEPPGVAGLQRHRHGAVVFDRGVAERRNPQLRFALAGGERGAARARVGQHCAGLGGGDGHGQPLGGLAGARELEDRIRAFGRVWRCCFDGHQREVVDRIARTGLIVQDPSYLSHRR